MQGNYSKGHTMFSQGARRFRILLATCWQSRNTANDNYHNKHTCEKHKYSKWRQVSSNYQVRKQMYQNRKK